MSRMGELWHEQQIEQQIMDLQEASCVLDHMKDDLMRIFKWADQYKKNIELFDTYMYDNHEILKIIDEIKENYKDIFN